MLRDIQLTNEEREEQLKCDIIIDNAMEYIRERATYLWNCGRGNDVNKIMEVGDEIEIEIRKLIKKLRITTQDIRFYR
jgi:hypothetical protein